MTKKHYYFVIFDNILINIENGARKEHKPYYCTPRELIFQLKNKPVNSIIKLD